MKKRLFYLISFSLIVISCNNETTDDHHILASSELQIPDDLKDKVENGNINSHTFKGVFSNISADFSISYETIVIDSLNSIVKSVKVVLDKGSDNCIFHSTIDESQFNRGNRESYSTYTNVELGYVKETLFSKKSENIVYVIHSDGTCKKLSDNKTN